jgi:hypothetical protein
MNAAANSRTTLGQVAHPAPARHRVSGWALAFALLAAPFVWSEHLLVNSALASSACTGADIFFGLVTAESAEVLMLISGLIALAVAAAGGYVAYSAWVATSGDDEASHHHVLEVGEGRTRFLALVGMVFSGGFFAASVFDVIALFMVPLCAN